MRKVFTIFFIFGLLVLSVQNHVSAQGITPTPTPVPGVVVPVIQPGTPLVADDNQIFFSQIYGGALQINGPYDTNTRTFGLPADWRLTEAALLNLNLTVSLNTSLVGGSGASTNTAGGVLSVFFNRGIVATLPITAAGYFTYSIPIPMDDLISHREDGRMEISFVLDSGISCTINQQLSIFIHPESQITFPHEAVLPPVSLARFPYPLYQDTIFPETALVVIPDNPTIGEVQSALTISAGLSNMTSSALLLDLVTLSQLTPDVLNANHLILVGNAANLPILSQMQLPLAPVNNAFGLNSVDDGVVELTHSIWNPAKVVLIVSGNTDSGVIKAAQSVTTGNLRSYSASNLAVVEEVQVTPLPVSIPVSQTLAELGYSGDTISRNTTSASGVTTTLSYKFFIPAGQIPSKDAYFELAFGHSALVNYERSAAVLLVNNQPVGSIRMGDNFAANSVNRVKFSIPSSAVINGFNRLDVQVSLFPRDTCTIPTLKGLWFNVWPEESNFYLPLMPAIISPASVLDLSAYPAPFVFDATLASTAFVIPRDDFPSWRSAFLIASYLGDRANGAITSLNAYYGDDVPTSERSEHNWIVIGQPSKLPVILDFNESMPAPFENNLASESGLQVKYRIPVDASLGYVELLQSPWNSNHVIFAVLGNTDLGVEWAANALLDSTLRGKLAGNFAVVNALQITTLDTRKTVLSPSAFPTPAGQNVDGEPVVPATIDLTPPAAERPGWLLQAMLLSGGLVIFIILAVIATSILRNRYQRK